MLNCAMLLDSATRFGLGKGIHILSCDAKNREFLVSLIGVYSIHFVGVI